MVTKIKQLFSDSFAFAFATLGNKMVSFLLLPILTRFLGTAAYGVWDITNTITMLISYICILGTDAAFAYYYFDVKTDEDKKSYFSITVFYSVGVSLFFLLVVSLFNGFFAELFYKESSYSNLIVLALIATVEAIFIQHLLALARYNRQVWTFNILSMTYWIGSVLLNVYFVVIGLGVEGILWGQIVAGAVTLLILIILYRNQFTIRLKKIHFINLLKYGFPIVPSLLSFWVMNSFSRPLIYHLSSPSDAGIYGAAIRFASFIALITSAFQLAWRPFAMSIKDREDAPQIFSIIARFLIVVGTLAILGITIFIKPIMLVITGKAFYISYPIVWMLSLSTLLNTLYVIFSVGLLFTKNTKEISKAFTLGTVFYFLLNIVIVPVYSYWGTAAITLLTYLFIIYYVYFKGQKYYVIPFKLKSITSYLLIYLCGMVMITYLQVKEVPYIWIYYLLISFTIIGAVFGTRIFSIKSVNVLRKNLRSIFLK